MITFILSLWLIAAAWVIYTFRRINRVYHFRKYVLELEGAYHSEQISRGIYDEPFYVIVESMPSYGAMVYSFKPLLLENWLTDEQFQKLRPYIQWEAA